MAAITSTALNHSSLRDLYLHCGMIPALKCRATFNVSLRDTSGSSLGEDLFSFRVVAVHDSGSVHLRGDESAAYSPATWSLSLCPCGSPQPFRLTSPQ